MQKKKQKAEKGIPETLCPMSQYIDDMLAKRRNTPVIIMFGMPETSGIPKRWRCSFDKPDTIPGLIEYYKTFMLGMHADPLFTSFSDLLDSADEAIAELEKAEIAVLSKFPGMSQKRAVQFGKTEIIMEKVLGIVQDAGDADPDNAPALFKKHLLKIDERKGGTATKDEVLHGEKSGTLLVKNEFVDSTTSYLRMISSDKLNWYVGDFGKKVKGTISKLNETPLKPGTLYYVRTMTDGKNGKSDWGPIFEIYCL